MVMALGDVPQPGWHTWVALAVMTAVALFGAFLYFGLQR
jgi:hypothetical protein